MQNHRSRFTKLETTNNAREHDGKNVPYSQENTNTAFKYKHLLFPYKYQWKDTQEKNDTATRSPWRADMDRHGEAELEMFST